MPDMPETMPQIDLRPQGDDETPVYTEASEAPEARHNYQLYLAVVGMAVVVAFLVWVAFDTWYSYVQRHRETPVVVQPAPVSGITATSSVTTGASTGDSATTTPFVDSLDADEVPAPVTPQPAPVTPRPEVVDVPDPQPKPKPTPSVRTTNVGMAVGETLSVLSEAELKRQLDDMVMLGVGWVRADLAWSSVQPNGPSEYQWANFDRVVREARERDIEVLAIITYTPRWARRGECVDTKKCEPADPAEFAEFAKAVAKRYAPQGVHTYEIWNEPNMQLFWAAGASAGRYTALLKASYTAIHEADPQAVVISGGLAAVATWGGNISAREYLERMYENGVQGYFDIMAYHPYSFPIAPHYYKESSPWSQMAETEWSVRSVMTANGDAKKPLWITEYGAPTGGPGSVADSSEHSVWSVPDHVTEGYQATILREAVEENASYSWSGPLFWYSYKDLGTNTGDKENFFGIIRYDGSKKPAYDVMRSLW